MKIKILIVLTFILTSLKVSTAQELIGNWKGTSLCQVKNSPCHDENVVYHISKYKGDTIYQVNAGKIIDRKENDMGTLYFTFDGQTNTLFLTDSVKEVRWEFKLTGKELTGTLISKGNLYRKIYLKKED